MQNELDRVLVALAYRVQKARAGAITSREQEAYEHLSAILDDSVGSEVDFILWQIDQAMQKAYTKDRQSEEDYHIFCLYLNYYDNLTAILEKNTKGTPGALPFA